MTVTALDMFSGAGGSSQGIHASGAEVIAAANHNTEALAVHAANFPQTDHFVADLVDPAAASYLRPADLPSASFLWASPSCRHHSPANATKLYAGQKATPLTLFDTDADDASDTEAHANSERSRVTMVCPLLYAEKHRPLAVIVENVVEVTRWGPNRDGSQFRDWLNRWDNLGYEHHACFFNSGFFGCPQSRDRIYIVFWLKGNTAPNLDHRPAAYCTSDQCCGKPVTARQVFKPRKPSWPLPRWGKYGTQYGYRCTDCDQPIVPHRPAAYEAIDWSDLGPTIGDRPRPLADRTIDRIKRGIAKFQDYPLAAIEDGRLVGMIIPNRINGRAYNSAVEQLPTVVAGANNLNVASIVLAAAGNTYERPGQTRARHITDQLFSQTGTLEHGIASAPFLIEMRGGGSIKSGQHPVTEPMHTVTAGGLHHGLVVSGFTKINGGPDATPWHPPTDPFGAIVGRINTGLIAATLPLTHANSGDRARHITEPLGTLTTARERYLINAASPAEVDVDEVHFRMLKPATELRRAMGFDDDYLLDGTKTQITQWLGNAVTPPVAAWLTEQVLATFDEPTSTRRRAA
ncbi:MAG: DNA cytosine methyltransferase [Actinomycetota bacterium]